MGMMRWFASAVFVCACNGAGSNVWLDASRDDATTHETRANESDARSSVEASSGDANLDANTLPFYGRWRLPGSVSSPEYQTEIRADGTMMTTAVEWLNPSTNCRESSVSMQTYTFQAPYLSWRMVSGTNTRDCADTGRITTPSSADQIRRANENEARATYRVVVGDERMTLCQFESVDGSVSEDAGAASCSVWYRIP